jgi:hypothetical protein
MKRDQQIVSHFLFALNAQYGESFTVVRWPDEENRQTPAVEAVASDSNGATLAIEHTLIQPFEGERIDSERFIKVFGRLEGHVELIKPGYNVNVTVRVGVIPNGVNWQLVADQVQRHLKRLIPVRGNGKTIESIEGLAFALPVTLGITPHDPTEEDHVWVSRYAAPDTLKKVVRSALERKLPKLIAEKASRRILLLEKADIANGHSAIREAIDVLWSDFPELAHVDEIWLAITLYWESANTLFFYELCPNVLDRRLKLDLKTSATTALGQAVGF